MTALIPRDARTTTTERDTMHWSDDDRLHFALGIEDTFVPQARPGERAIDEYELTDHYRRYASDLGLAVEVGAELLRWGVPWYRVTPSRPHMSFTVGQDVDLNAYRAGPLPIASRALNEKLQALFEAQLSR